MASWTATSPPGRPAGSRCRCAPGSAASRFVRACCCAARPGGASSARSWTTTTASACRGWRPPSSRPARPWPAPVRDRIPINCTMPVVDPEPRAGWSARRVVRTAKVKVADPGVPLAADCERVAAVRDALGPGGRIRVDANAIWDVATAVTAIRALERAAGGLEYVEQPCPSLAELARRTGAGVRADRGRRVDPAGRGPDAGRGSRCRRHRGDQGGAAGWRAAGAGGGRGVRAAVRRVVGGRHGVGLAAGLALAGALPDAGVRVRAGHAVPAGSTS